MCGLGIWLLFLQFREDCSDTSGGEVSCFGLVVILLAKQSLLQVLKHLWNDSIVRCIRVLWS